MSPTTHTTMDDRQDHTTDPAYRNGDPQLRAAPDGGLTANDTHTFTVQPDDPDEDEEADDG